MFGFLADNEMRDYFCTLPRTVQKKIMQYAGHIESLEHLKAIAKEIMSETMH